MYNEDMNELLTEENISSSAKVQLAQCERDFTIAKNAFNNELRSGKNASVSYTRLTRVVDMYPEQAPQIAIRRAVTTAGLAALSKSPYLYSHMTRCLKNTTNRLIRAETVNGAVNNVLNSAIVNFENRLKHADDNEVQTGIKTVLNTLKTCLQLVKSYGSRKNMLKAANNEDEAVQKVSETLDCVDISDEDLAVLVDNFLTEAFNVGAIYFENDECIINENLRSATRKVVGGVSNVSNTVSRAVDTVTDTVRDQKYKNDLIKIRKEVMSGKKSISTYIKYAMAVIAWDTHVIPEFAIVLIVRSWMKRKKMRQQEQLNLINELRTELEIINEKIKDAEVDNDRQKKYNYMRLRREIQRAIDQIKFGQRVNINRHGMKM